MIDTFYPYFRWNWRLSSWNRYRQCKNGKNRNAHWQKLIWILHHGKLIFVFKLNSVYLITACPNSFNQWIKFDNTFKFQTPLTLSFLEFSNCIYISRAERMVDFVVKYGRGWCKLYFKVWKFPQIEWNANATESMFHILWN